MKLWLHPPWSEEETRSLTPASRLEQIDFLLGEGLLSQETALRILVSGTGDDWLLARFPVRLDSKTLRRWRRSP